MTTPTQCTKCLAGTMRTIRSRRVGNSQQRRIECKGCGHRETIIVPRNKIRGSNFFGAIAHKADVDAIRPR